MLCYYGVVLFVLLWSCVVVLCCRGVLLLCCYGVAFLWSCVVDVAVAVVCCHVMELRSCGVVLWSVVVVVLL